MSWAVVAGTAIAGGIGLIGTWIATSASEEAAAAAAAAATAAADVEAAAATDAADTAAAAALEAAEIQAEAAAAALAEQTRQFEEMQEILRPWIEQGTEALAGLEQYQDAGSDALVQMRALMGLDGPDAQRAAIEQISGGAEMAGLFAQGEDAIMQSGAATGGLRGGNVQGALAQFRPQMLSSLINQQYGRLGGLVDMGQGITMNRAALGQASAAGLASGNLTHASSLGNLLMQQGGALAGGVLGAGNANASGILGAGNANAGGILGAGNARAGGILGAGNAWANLPGYFAQGGMFGLGLANRPGAF